MNIDSILGLIGSPILGAVGGVMGNLLTTLLAFFKSKQDHKQAIEMKKLEIEAAREAYESAERIKAADSELTSKQLLSGEYTATLTHDTAELSTDGSRLLVLAEFVRRTYRAFITTCLLGSAVSFFFSEFADAAMRAAMVNATIGATIMAVTWWFADRSLAGKTGESGFLSVFYKKP